MPFLKIAPSPPSNESVVKVVVIAKAAMDHCQSHGNPVARRVSGPGAISNSRRGGPRLAPQRRSVRELIRSNSEDSGDTKRCCPMPVGSFSLVSRAG